MYLSFTLYTRTHARTHARGLRNAELARARLDVTSPAAELAVDCGTADGTLGALRCSQL